MCISDVCICVCERERQRERGVSHSPLLTWWCWGPMSMVSQQPPQTPCLPGRSQDLTLKTVLQRPLPLRPGLSLEIPAPGPKNSEDGDWGKMGCGGNQGTVRHGVTVSRCPMRKRQRTASIRAAGCRVHSLYPLLFWSLLLVSGGLPGASDRQESACNTGDLGLTPGLGSSPGGGNGNPLQDSQGESYGQRSLVGSSPCSHKKNKEVGHH